MEEIRIRIEIIIQRFKVHFVRNKSPFLSLNDYFDE